MGLSWQLGGCLLLAKRICDHSLCYLGVQPLTRDGYTPDWSSECKNCGATPCVDVVQNGHIRHQSELCAVCFFGDRSKLDIDTWNDEDDE